MGNSGILPDPWENFPSYFGGLTMYSRPLEKSIFCISLIPFLTGLFLSGLLGVFGIAVVGAQTSESATLMKRYLSKTDLQGVKLDMERLLKFLPADKAAGLAKINWLTFESPGSNIPQPARADAQRDNQAAAEIQSVRQKALVSLEAMEFLYSAYDHIFKEEFGLALLDIEKIEAVDHRIWPGTQEAVKAFSLEQLVFTDRSWEWHSSDGYKGPHWDESAPSGLPIPADEILSFSAAVGSGYLKFFVLDLLKAEIAFSLGNFEKAGKIYSEKVEAQGRWSHRGRENQITPEELKFIKIRQAMNFLALGDFYYRRAQAVGENAKENALEKAKENYRAVLNIQILDNLSLNQFPAAIILCENFKGLEAIRNSFLRMADTNPIDLGPIEDEVDDLRPERLCNKGVPPDNFTDSIEHLLLQDFEQLKPGSVIAIDLPQGRATVGYAVGGKSRSITYYLSSKALGSLDMVLNDPQIIEIISRAALQINKIEQGLNYLGYWEKYVPVQKYHFLYTLAKDYANQVIQTEARYLQFKAEAENQEYQSSRLEQDLTITHYQEQIANVRAQIASGRSQQADLKIFEIDQRIEEAEGSNFWGIFGAVFATIAGAVVSVASLGTATPLAIAGGAAAITAAVATGVSGTVSSQISTDHEVAALQYQRQASFVDKIIAIREGQIAGIEKTIAQAQGAHLGENIQFLGQKELSQDLYYALAKVMNRIKGGYLEGGIQLGYLAERALAFETPHISPSFIKFNYSHSGLKNLLAGDLFREDLERMEFNRVLALQQRNQIKHVVSLRQNYPLEFSGFIDKGRMKFSTTLLEFDKNYPGTYHRRLRKVEVVVQGLIGPEGFKGSLTNSGVFLDREKNGTMSSVRLLPTAEEMNEALRKMRNENSLSLTAGGVRVFNHSPVRLVLSKFDMRTDGIVFPSDPSVRGIFEDFGVAGLWHLELPKTINETDYRSISDVKLILYFDALFDPHVEAKVKALSELYHQELMKGDQLDRMTAFSLRQHFPDEFFSLASGSIGIELLNGDFPNNMTEKKVKRIIIRALDQNGKGLKGIDLKLSDSTNKLVFQSTTLEDGFTVNPNDFTLEDFPVEKRVPIVGQWKISLIDPTQAIQVGDLQILFSYEYKTVS